MEETEQKLESEIKVEIKDKKRAKRMAVISRIKRKLLARHVGVVRMGIILGGAGLMVAVFLAGMGILRITGLARYVRLVRIFVMVPEKEIAVTEGKTNILILGKAGEGHTAADLTDTMILASISDGEEPRITMLSIPRDIWVVDLRAKINSAYYWGNQKREGGGLVLAKSAVEEVVGVPVHYGAVIDFGGFVKLIDAMGGVEVEVERGFTDRDFPIAGRENDECGGDTEYRCRYETVIFEAGRQLMDGERALKFVRSRHSESEEEGDDFARGQRQQKVLSAVREKLMSREMWLAPRKMMAVWESAREMTETDLTEEALALLARRVYDARGRIETFSIPEEMLVNPPKMVKYDNLYVLIPGAEDWSEVWGWVREVLP